MKGLQDVKVESPSTLQKKIFNTVKEKKDLVINTKIEDAPEIGYLLSLLNEISKSERRQGTRAIILAGDEERAKQLDEWIWAIGYHASIESACVTDDKGTDEQVSAVSAGPVILVATPTKLAAILEKNRMIYREVQQLIVDQAELIQDWDAVEAISNRIIGKCQRIFTASKDSKELREAESKMLTEPDLVTKEEKKKQKAEKKPSVPKDLTQYYINVPPRSKISTLMAHLDQVPTEAVVVFTASRKTADRLYKIFRKSNKRAVSIHNSLDKDTFNERFGRFTSGNVQHLIAGDLSASDLPLKEATQVINYDVPEDVNEYKLRAELVGDGKKTRIISLVSKQDRSDIQSICDSLGYAPEEVPLPKGVKAKAEKKGKSSSGRGKSDKQKKSKSGGRSKKPREKKKGRKMKGLPRPTFDQLEGGRTGDRSDEKKGIVGLIKKIFSR
ncbi:MAG TPA: DEAD/DEAH box helicase [Balneolaceae bacterium]|nr:DEAD/DEAH box helicase [Balneolaceae bacterium]